MDRRRRQCQVCFVRLPLDGGRICEPCLQVYRNMAEVHEPNKGSKKKDQPHKRRTIPLLTERAALGKPLFGEP